jgi:hypothetical protein
MTTLPKAIMLGAIAATLASANEPAKPLAHEQRAIQGWTVQVDTRLLAGPDVQLGKRCLALLDAKLMEIALVLPADKVQQLRKVTIWLDRTHGKLHSMQYHPSADWLAGHGFSTNLAKCVHLPDAEDFASPDHFRRQPWAVLHELAHAYHDQVLDFDHPDVLAAWRRIKASGRFDSVLLIDGRRVRHYALTDQKEFFAEMTEAYFGMNDFFPFNRGELKDTEPEIHALMKKIWEGP